MSGCSSVKCLARVCALATIAIAATATVAQGATPIKSIRLTAFNKSASRSPTSALAVDPSTDTIAVTGAAGANPNIAGNGRVWVVNGHSGKIIKTIDLSGADSAGIAVDAATGVFYVSDPYDPSSSPQGTVVVIDARTGKVTHELPEAGVTGAIAVNSKTDRIYATGPGYGVTVIDGHTDATLATVPDVFYPSGIAADPLTDTIFVAGGASGGTTGVWEINGKTNTTIGGSSASPVTIATPYPAAAVASNSANGVTYVLTGTAGTVAVISKGGTRFSHTTHIRNLNAGSVAVDSAASSVFVSGANEVEGCPNFVAAINGRTNKITGKTYISTAGAIGVDPATRTVWVTNGGSLDHYPVGFTNKEPKCGNGGVTLGG